MHGGAAARRGRWVSWGVASLLFGSDVVHAEPTRTPPAAASPNPVSPSPASTTRAAPAISRAAPLAIGETFTIESKRLGELRRINVYTPPRSPASASEPLPVLYMPDGGIAEDFLHVAGLVQVSVGNGTMRPFLLVGIENTERRRDLTGPTQRVEDRAIAPRVGGSSAFRQFLRDELMPAIAARYLVSSERAIVGESLAGLFIVETFLLQPELFDSYLAFDPSVGWNGEALLRHVEARWRSRDVGSKALYLATSSEPTIREPTVRLVDALRAVAPRGLRLTYQPLPAETHATLYHPAALGAFRTVLRAPR
jgi:uncharacterized protein